jgi:23S rRNA (uracil1939-C5)-methyltransferase
MTFERNPALVSNRDDTPKSRMWIELGLFKPGTHMVQDIGHCPVQADKLNALLGFLRGELGKTDIPIYDERTHKGVLRYLVMRTNRLQTQILITFITNGEHPRLRTLARTICDRFTQVCGVLMHVNTTRGNAIFSTAAEECGEGDHTGNDVVLAGNNALVEQLCGLTLRFSATSFMQINPELAEKVYFRIQEIADPQPQETVLDLYCGVGSIGLLLAQRAGRVIGIEETPTSIDDARFNAQQNRLGNAEFHAGRAEAVLPALQNSGGLKKADVVTLNPSRRGCQKSVLEAIAALNPRMVLYMSCNPKTLVRDLAHLDAAGYRTVSLEPFDMFPRTKHYEVLACLVRSSRKP